MSPEAVALVSSLRPITEVLGEQAADRQQPVVRGRGRGRGFFAAATMRRAAAAAASTTPGGRQQMQPEVADAEETENMKSRREPQQLY